MFLDLVENYIKVKAMTGGCSSCQESSALFRSKGKLTSGHQNSTGASSLSPPAAAGTLPHWTCKVSSTGTQSGKWKSEMSRAHITPHPSHQHDPHTG